MGSISGNSWSLLRACSPGHKDYSRLSVICSMAATCKRLLVIDRTHFNPPPKVDSCVVQISPKPVLEGVDFAVSNADAPPHTILFSAVQAFDEFLRIAFSHKNKTLKSTFMAPLMLKQLWPALSGSSIGGNSDEPNSEAASQTDRRLDRWADPELQGAPRVPSVSPSLTRRGEFGGPGQLAALADAAAAMTRALTAVAGERRAPVDMAPQVCPRRTRACMPQPARAALPNILRAGPVGIVRFDAAGRLCVSAAQAIQIRRPQGNH
jgi:hypothetical protein